MPKRVLILGEYGVLNGGENSFLSIAPLLNQLGWELTAAAPTPSEFSQALISMGVPTIDWSLHTAKKRKSQTQIRAELAELIRSIKPDLVHCNSLSTSRLCGPVTCEMNLPSLGYLRDIMKLSRQATTDINQLARIIAVSRATKQWHCESGIDAGKTFVIPNGVDPDKFFPYPGANRSRIVPDGVPGIGPRLLFVGQIGMRKGVDILLDSFLAVAKQIPDVNLLIVGTRNSLKQEAIDFERSLIARAASTDLFDQIHWLGRRNDIAELMRCSTMLIHPARQEPLGRVLLEAAASGLPIVTTRVGGSPEILRGPELAECLVDPDDCEQLVGRIVRLLRQPDRLAGMGRCLRIRAIEDFSIDQCAAKLNQHYHQVLED